MSRQEREQREQVAHNAAEERREEHQAVKDERVKSLADEALDIGEPEASGAAPAAPQLVEYTLRFRGTEQQLLKLREYMTAQGIAYERIA
jgi:hypothetical protein